MNTTNSNNHVSRISSKARWARMAAVVAVAGLGMTAPFASAGPVLVLSDNIKVIDSIKITAFLLDINGPDVITIKANEAHLLSEYFSISKTTVDFAFIAAAGGVTDVNGALEIEMRGQCREVVGVVIHVVAVAGLGRASVAAAVMGDDAVAVALEEQHLRVPVIG